MKSKIPSLLTLFIAGIVYSHGAALAMDKDNNPPGPKGGPGASPDKSTMKPMAEEIKPIFHYQQRKKNKAPADTNGNGVVDEAEKKKAIERWKVKNKKWEEARQKKLKEVGGNSALLDVVPKTRLNKINPPEPKGGLGKGSADSEKK